MVVGRLIAVAGVYAVACKSPQPIDLKGIDRSGGELPSIVVEHVAKPPVIDGRLDDAPWKTAQSTGPFVSPIDGKVRPQSKVNAEARLLWDEQGLYLAFEVHDPAPTSPFGETDNDPHIWSAASGVEIMLQPGDRRDNKNYYEIQIDVAEAVWDTRFDDYNQPVVKASDGKTTFGHQLWDSQLVRAVSLLDGRYVVEAMIPWQVFGQAGGAPAAGESWRANFYSFRDGQRDALAWSPILGKGNFHRSSRFGSLRFQR